MTSTPPLPPDVQHLATALPRQVALRDQSARAWRAAYHRAVALLHDVTLECDLLREDRNRLLNELRQLRQQFGLTGVRRSIRDGEGRAA
jgi:hypothetical protein